MKNYKYNELEYAELIYNNGIQTKHIYTELKLLVLYYRDILKYPPRIRKKELEKFCKQYIAGFNMAKHYIIFDRTLRRGSDKRNKLITISKISIYVEEFNYINSLEIGYNLKKVLFAFLVQNKLNKEFYKLKNDIDLDNNYFKGGRRQYNEIKKCLRSHKRLKF